MLHVEVENVVTDRHRPSTVTLAAHARRGLIISCIKKSKVRVQWGPPGHDMYTERVRDNYNSHKKHTELPTPCNFNNSKHLIPIQLARTYLRVTYTLHHYHFDQTQHLMNGYRSHVRTMMKMAVSP